MISYIVIGVFRKVMPFTLVYKGATQEDFVEEIEYATKVSESHLSFETKLLQCIVTLK